jgi:simple sugar transport system ATP-binding protein
MFHGRVVAEFPAGWTDEQLVAAMEGMTATADTNDTKGPTGHVRHD